MRNHKLCLNHLLKITGLNPDKIDIFVHVWKDEVSMPPSRIVNMVDELKLPNELNHPIRFKQTFPQLYQAFHSSDEALEENQLRQLYRATEVVLEDEAAFEQQYTFLKQRFPSLYNMNQFKQFYKIHACNALKKAAESTRGEKYHYVFRLRPDAFYTPIPLHCIEQSLNDDIHTVCGNYRLTDHFSDQFWGGRSEVIDIMSSIWETILFHPLGVDMPADPPERRIFAERLVALHGFGHGLRLKVAPWMQARLLNATESIQPRHLYALAQDIGCLKPSIVSKYRQEFSKTYQQLLFWAKKFQDPDLIKKINTLNSIIDDNRTAS